MLHEILLSLSGHPSPLLRTAGSAGPSAIPPGSTADRVLSPPERALLASIAHLSDLHVKLLSFTAQISASHPSTICRAVATAIDSGHLGAFQKKVLEVEDSILRKDAGLVGAYNIVPLTAVVGEFEPWTRRMEWLWDIVQFMLKSERAKDAAASTPCTGSKLIDRLRGELQTGYADVEETARSLVRVAELAWLKQVSAWVLYGQLPSFGSADFFIQRSEDTEEEYICDSNLLPSFVSRPTAASMLFIGRSLNRIRSKSNADPDLQGQDHLSSQLKELSKLTYPLDSATFARTITQIRQFLSRTTLQRLLPLSRVMEMLNLLRDFFLLGRGEFAMALTQQADEKIRSRWRRADNLAYERRDGLGNVVLKEGEVSAVLSRTWAALGSMQGQHAEEDEGLEMARDLLRLTLSKLKTATPSTPAAAEGGLTAIAPTPFRNLLFSVPAVLTLQIPSPLDLFLSQYDLQTYTAINSYLISIRRAHIRLTDLWKITSLRRHHPSPPAPPYGSSRAGREKVRLLRKRQTARENSMRSAWATSSAAIFFLSEMEGYLQTEVVAGLWEGFQRWITTGSDEPRQDPMQSKPRTGPPTPDVEQNLGDDAEADDIWLATSTTDSNPLFTPLKTPKTPNPTTGTRPPSRGSQLHDPQTLTMAHRTYLRTLVGRLLLTHRPFTDPLYELLAHIDRLVALVHRLHGIWSSADLESDVGVVDAFVDHEREERDVRGEIARVEAAIREGVEGVVGVLRGLEGAPGGSLLVGPDEEDGKDGGKDGGTNDDTAFELEEEQGAYVPRRVGGVDRLLMKLDFGSWFASGRDGLVHEDDDP